MIVPAHGLERGRRASEALARWRGYRVPKASLKGQACNGASSFVSCPPPGEEPATVVSLATLGYFETVRIPLRAGRWFDDRDDGEGPAVVVINETLARQHWPESDPLDQRVTVQLSGEAHAAEIVGVVGTVRPRGFESLPRPEVFLPHAQYPDGSMTYVVRTAGDPAAAIPAIQDVIWAAAPLETFYSVATVDQLLAGTLAARRFTTILAVRGDVDVRTGSGPIRVERFGAALRARTGSGPAKGIARTAFPDTALGRR